MKNPFSSAQCGDLIAALCSGDIPDGVQLHGCVPDEFGIVCTQALDVEQTNDSFVVRADQARAPYPQTIWKFYADLPDGLSPEVVLPQFITKHIPTLVGYMTYSLDGNTYTLGIITEFLGTAQDCWSAIHNDSMRPRLLARSAELGTCLGEIHQELFRNCPHSHISGVALANQLNVRLDEFAQASELISPFVSSARQLYNQLTQVATIPTQRIHGDLHLGQILSDTSGFYFLDFEGEPGSDNTVLDSPLRDIAGIARSFHYAGLEFPQHEFLSGYRQTTSDETLNDMVLSAYIVDRFLYEVIYELNHRPDWVERPLSSAHFIPVLR
ncbi:phosphotransferase [Corynebacterium sp. sy039]|uniref:phosphotransferase n=1 Tax=Corynebacterium sp. sy039 TaxID=2599641 RepID=UPI0011B5CC8F|nr:phosphotransferase [Corynebacterium sp. sy039]QDZ43027.1 phosphotransferase [Corynebacterium sp. sy039]